MNIKGIDIYNALKELPLEKLKEMDILVISESEEFGVTWNEKAIDFRTGKDNKDLIICV